MEMREEILKGYKEGIQEDNKNIVNNFLEKFKGLNIDIFKSNTVVVEYEKHARGYCNILKIFVDGKAIFSKSTDFIRDYMNGEYLYHYLQYNMDKFMIIQDILGVSIKRENVSNPCEYKCSSGILWWKKEWVETHDFGIDRYTIDFSNIK